MYIYIYILYIYSYTHIYLYTYFRRCHHHHPHHRGGVLYRPITISLLPQLLPPPPPPLPPPPPPLPTPQGGGVRVLGWVIYIYIHIFIFFEIYTYIYIFIYVFIFICRYIYIYSYTHIYAYFQHRHHHHHPHHRGGALYTPITISLLPQLLPPPPPPPPPPALPTPQGYIYIYLQNMHVYSVQLRPILLGLRGCNEVVCRDDLERLTDMVPRLSNIRNATRLGSKVWEYILGMTEWMVKWLDLLFDDVWWISNMKYVVWCYAAIFMLFKTGWHPQDAQPHTRTHNVPSLCISKYLCLSTATLWRYQDLGRENRSFADGKACLSRRKPLLLIVGCRIRFCLCVCTIYAIIQCVTYTGMSGLESNFTHSLADMPISTVSI